MTVLPEDRLRFSDLDDAPDGFWYHYDHAPTIKEKKEVIKVIVQSILRDLDGVGLREDIAVMPSTKEDDDAMRESLRERILLSALDSYFDDLLSYARRIDYDDNVSDD